MRGFPSGHAATICAVAAAMGVLLPKYRDLFWTAGGLVALARVVTNAHYLTDVLAGAWIGAVTALVLAVYMLPAGLGPADNRGRERA
jgi:membrane-associated phospholipid phosphatase